MAVQIGMSALVLILLLLLFIGTRPAEFCIQRGAQIDASPEAIFPFLNDLRKWAKWSPWEKLDPNMRKTFSGPSVGTGASQTWSGNGKAGQGQMTIIESKPNALVSVELKFIKPFVATNRATFTLSPSAGGTDVHWIMEGRNGFAAKAFGTFVNMDKLLGKDFEEGLANLQAAVRA
jgi:uncharacterized protein YndB with AHSA1/START domain